MSDRTFLTIAGIETQQGLKLVVSFRGVADNERSSNEEADNSVTQWGLGGNQGVSGETPEGFGVGRTILVQAYNL